MVIFHNVVPKKAPNFARKLGVRKYIFLPFIRSSFHFRGMSSLGVEHFTQLYFENPKYPHHNHCPQAPRQSVHAFK